MQPCPQSREQQKHSLATEVLRGTGQLRLAAMGQSMLPAIWPGDLLSIRAIEMDQVQPGDVILFTREGRFFIHRVVQMREAATESTGRSLVTRGDSMRESDAPVSPEELLGRVETANRNGAGELPVLQASGWMRAAGRMLAYSDLLRRVALRLHAWRSRDRVVNNTEVVAREIPLR